ncbi:uncharacterized protein YcnI [Arthrobacter sp. AG258]|uniref:YcnI family copper-binding membrane protein n=1 Tax=Arthrobacter sp. AG258 TaxID=2183899 RepID=UPI00105D3EB5|nr:YcnI family protein [Arthrobacter sp. AG258]TDT86031.1 uncharacterized protein YcnI [Arthrobacter sp. AG258]
MNTSIRRTARAFAAITAAAGMLAAGAAAASAHVSVDPGDTGANGYSRLTFNVPNESPTAKTNKLEVKLPTDTPFTSVSVKPVEGWTAQVITGDLPTPVTVAGATVTKAPTSVVWTADEAHQLGQNQYQAFSLSVGRLPAEGTTVVLEAAQGYSDGTVVNWNERSADGQPEPKHPAPSFTTTAEDGAAAHTTPASAAASTAPEAPEAIERTSDATSIWGVVLGAAGFVLGAAALALVLAGRRSRPAAK